ncbi:TetR/AcrR family transcriptional regulator [Couchioplanes azureus]|uniref:TetR/AcrR family transcriptional regulator n=1 Tax=Couchioplanes caeruleus TaxID=56438 RepID=UPI0016708FCD|nr:TetR/AcrR family transcriptional regulator [Couchioplanes caeruleus]GGQ48154.1 TetR family transcriptional regulator [Couchioplanes caeruleus subsp. azureus]
MSMELLWGGRARPSRGPRPTLDLAGLAEAGVALADAEGLAAVSMQRVAAALGVTKMALYRYVPGKAELVALMLERAIGAPPRLDPGDWRTGLARWSRALLDAYLRHPWVLDATVGPRPLGPHELTWMEAGLRLLAGTGLRGAERLDTLAALAAQARSIADQARAGADPEAQLTSVIATVLREHGERFPALAAAVAESTDDEREQAFEFGLERILDGLAALMHRRAP